jgi:hypothetical protein
MIPPDSWQVPLKGMTGGDIAQISPRCLTCTSKEDGRGIQYIQDVFLLPNLENVGGGGGGGQNFFFKVD